MIRLKALVNSNPIAAADVAKELNNNLSGMGV